MLRSDVADGVLARRHAVSVSEVCGTVPVLFLHGFGTSQTMWARVLPAISADRTTILMDHLGAGASQVEAYDAHRHQSLRGYADDVLAVLDVLALGPVDLVGHSAGGMIGALASADRPDLIRSLALIGASPRYLDDDGYVGGFSPEALDDLFAAMQANYVGWSRSLAPYVMANPDRPELAEEIADSFVRTGAEIAVDFARAIFYCDFRADLPRVTAPTLLIQASADPMVPEEVGHYLHDAIVGSRLELMEATGHFPHISGPDETGRILGQHLASQPVS